MARAYRMVARAEAVELTRARIIEAAIELFGQRAYDLVSLADVARAGDLGLATVVRQFTSKEQLFAACVAAASKILDSGLDSTPENDPVAAVHTAVEGYEHFGDAIVRLSAQEDRVPAARAVLEHGTRVHLAWIDRVFAGTLSGLRGRARKVRAAQLKAATDVQFWKLLRRDLRLNRSETEVAMLEIVEALCR
jgi:AcrR family transcriptional regulator